MMPDDVLPAHWDYCVRETDWFLRGALYATDATWVGHPAYMQQAESKLYQLSVARKIGFTIPDTTITNAAEEVSRFYEELRSRVVAKPLRTGYFDYGDRQACVFTEVLAPDDLQDKDALTIAPVIYQQHLAKECDVRVTVVGNDVFAAAIDSQSVQSAVTDWRKSETEDLPHSRHRLPDHIRTLCLDLLREMGLSFGAIDLVLTPDGTYYFLEVNPNGQWLWIEDRLGYPISECIARWLVDHAG